MDLAPIKNRLAKATPGEWELGYHYHVQGATFCKCFEGYGPLVWQGVQALVAAAEHDLRKKWAEEVLNEGILGAGYSVLMNPNRGEHPVTTFTRAVKHMLNLLEGATK